MPNHTTGRVLALAAGLACTAGTLVILLGDALLTPMAWTRYHVLTLLMVGGTIAFGHLIGTAWRARSWFAAAGCAVLFIAGTALVVIQSVGRQAETTEMAQLTVTAHNDEIARLKAQAADLRQTLAYARPGRNAECEGAPDPLPARGWPECRRKRASVAALEESLAKAEARLSELGAPAPVAPKADKVADILALLGLDRVKARAGFMLIEPFLWTLFFEIGAIVSLGFAFRHTVAVVVRAGNDNLPSATASPTAVGPGPEPGASLPAGGAGQDHLDDVVTVLRRAGRPVSNRELARMLGVSEATAYRRTEEAMAAGLATKGRDGRQMAIKLSGSDPAAQAAAVAGHRKAKAA